MRTTLFERFTDRARRVVVLAQEEARMLNHNYIGTEHLLLGLIHEGEGVAALALERIGLSLQGVREQVEEIIGLGEQTPDPRIPFTPRAKKVLELSLREALQLGHNYVGTEHILLGLIREGEGVAAQVLVKVGADLNRVRQQVIQLLSGYQGKESDEPAKVEKSLDANTVLDRFTSRSHRVVALAKDEARMLNHNYIGTEHILLGLISEGEGLAMKALEVLEISPQRVRQQVLAIIGQGQQASSGNLPFTPRTEKVFELSLREALQLGHNYIGTEHLLLGLIREGEGVAGQVLVSVGGDLNRVRQQVIQLLSGYQGKEPAAAEVTVVTTPPPVPPADQGGVFICYRREDSAWAAGRIYDELVRQRGVDSVFIDVDSIEPGRDFMEAAMEAMTSCQYVLVLIGPRWLHITDETGLRRLDSPHDYVRTELEVALRLDKRIVPALVEGAIMPRADQLPASIANLTRRNAIQFEITGFQNQMRNLLRVFGTAA